MTTSPEHAPHEPHEPHAPRRLVAVIARDLPAARLLMHDRKIRSCCALVMTPRSWESRGCQLSEIVIAPDMEDHPALPDMLRDAKIGLTK